MFYTESSQNLATVHPNDTDITWEEAKQKIILKCQAENEYFINLALAISKYHYSGAPSEWAPENNPEQLIFDWTAWTIENADLYKYTIEDILWTYEQGLIPDAFTLLIDYFC